jgi:ubiquinone/menaquinone biosynthesis C-methylase UbiE
VTNSYARVAAEYYDGDLHPTSSDFGFASYQLLKKNKEILFDAQSMCEVGAGKSTLLRVLLEENIRPTKLIISDLSSDMLQYSKDMRPTNAQFIICDATKIPVDESTFDLTVSLLGDPYNSRALWLELNRILKVGGVAFYTTPSWEWANEFRDHATDERRGAALFQTKHAGSVYVPSQVLPETHQAQLIGEAGFDVLKICRFTVEELLALRGRASPKISNYLTKSTPIVTAFVAKKFDS